MRNKRRKKLIEKLKNNNPYSLQLIEEKTIKELAMLCYDIYDPTTNRVPKDWFLWGIGTGDYGFSGAIFYKVQKFKPSAWAIVIRGTEISELGNLKDDLFVAMEKTPSQLASTKKFIDEEISLIRNFPMKDFLHSWETDPVYITGHSLGAITGSLLFSEIGIKDERFYSINFDNPGALNIVKEHNKNNNFYTASPRVINIQSDVNVINTCNEQWGDVYRTLRYDFSYGSERQPTIIERHCFDNSYYPLSYSIDQHAIVNIAHSLISNYFLIKDDRNIFGFENGYFEYTNPETRKDYWQQYCQYCWDNNCQDVRREFKTLEQFTNVIFSDLNFMHNPSFTESWPNKKKCS